MLLTLFMCVVVLAIALVLGGLVILLYIFVMVDLGGFLFI